MQRRAFYNNKLAATMPATARAASALMAMPVTACSTERVNSKLGKVFTADRNALGLEKAEALVYVQQNDPVTRNEREYEVMVE